MALTPKLVLPTCLVAGYFAGCSSPSSDSPWTSSNCREAVGAYELSEIQRGVRNALQNCGDDHACYENACKRFHFRLPQRAGSTCYTGGTYILSDDVLAERILQDVQRHRSSDDEPWYRNLISDFCLGGKRDGTAVAGMPFSELKDPEGNTIIRGGVCLWQAPSANTCGEQ